MQPEPKAVATMVERLGCGNCRNPADLIDDAGWIFAVRQGPSKHLSIGYEPGYIDFRARFYYLNK
jgi:hypothetical protein